MASVSVLLATYNGEAFLREQIRSILAARRNHDLEIIVSDDGSTDATLAVLAAELPHDAKIFHNHFHSPTHNFEFLIAQASRSIVLLCDQDDVWLPHKIDCLAQVLNEPSTVTLAVSDAQLIDEFGTVIAGSFFKTTGGFRSGVLANVFRNRYLGCAMAFRREMVRYFLPFPQDVPMHDMWLGIVNDLYGKTQYLAEPLLQYRRHRRNVTPARRTGLTQVFKWRFSLVKGLIRLVLKHSFSKG